MCRDSCPTAVPARRPPTTRCASWRDLPVKRSPDTGSCWLTKHRYRWLEVRTRERRTPKLAATHPGIRTPGNANSPRPLPPEPRRSSQRPPRHRRPATASEERGRLGLFRASAIGSTTLSQDDAAIECLLPRAGRIRHRRTAIDAPNEVTTDGLRTVLARMGRSGGSLSTADRRR